MILLLNSAVMPTEGVYTLKRISKAVFQTILYEAASTGGLQSYIGYPKTAQLIEQFTGIEIEVSREQAELTTGDVMLIVKLRHRIPDPSDIAAYQPSLEDLDFFVSYWRPLAEEEKTE